MHSYGNLSIHLSNLKLYFDLFSKRFGLRRSGGAVVGAMEVNRLDNMVKFAHITIRKLCSLF